MVTTFRLLIVMLVLGSAAACGDDGAGSGTPTPRRTPAPPGTTVTSQAIDLAVTDAVEFSGIDSGDLVSGSHSLALGDFNDDGETDLLVGAPQGDGPENDRADAGEAYVVFGPLEEEASLGDADIVVYGAAAGDSLGYAVLAADVNSDGVDDVIVGAPGVTAGFDPRTDQGRVYVFYGGEDAGDEGTLDLDEDVFDFTLTGAEGFGRLGAAMAAGDVNGDDATDLIAGAPFAGRKPGSAPGGERTAVGEVYVVFGSDALSGEWNVARDEYDMLISGSTGFAQFGASVAVAEVNGDETADIAIGAYRAAGDDGRPAASGAVYVVHGSRDLPARVLTQEGDQDVTVYGPDHPASFGFPLAAADMSGDGVADLAGGGQQVSSGLFQSQGGAFVMYGANDLPSRVAIGESAGFTVVGQMTSELLPSALVAADLDGDGAAELILGSALAGPDERPGSGLVYVLDVQEGGRTVDLSKDEPSILIAGERADDRLGGSIAAAPGGSSGSEGSGALIAILAANADPAEDRQDAGIVYIVRVGQ